MVTIDGKGGVAAGTSTNGANHKVPGRVGDAPVPGAGAYADAEVGGCGATGDGDQMMRLLPTYLGVELMRQGASPGDAAKAGVERVAKFYPDFWGAIVCVNVHGEHGGAATQLHARGHCTEAGKWPGSLPGRRPRHRYAARPGRHDRRQ